MLFFALVFVIPILSLLIGIFFDIKVTYYEQLPKEVIESLENRVLLERVFEMDSASKH